MLGKNSRLRCAAALSALAPCAALCAQTARADAYPTLRIVEELRVELDRHKVMRPTAVVVAPDGRLLVVPPNGSPSDLIALDSTGREVLWRLPLEERGAGNVWRVRKSGWIGSRAWIADTRAPRVVLFDARGRVVQYIDVPTQLVPGPGAPNRAAATVEAEVVAVCTDRTLLVRVIGPRSRSGARPELDSVFRVAEHGSVLQRVAHLPLQRSTYPDSSALFGVPSRFVARWAASQEGTRIALVVPTPRDVANGVARVVMLDARGDTVYTRRVRINAIRLPDALIWQRLDDARERSPVPWTDSVRALAERAIVRYRDPVATVLVGPDGSAALRLETEQQGVSQAEWILLAPNGSDIGRLVVPRDMRLATVDQSRVWLMQDGPRAHATLGVYRIYR